MNEFTKEELKTIHMYLRGNPPTYELAGKIQSMLDNYCEHQLQGPRMLSLCTKCREYV